MQLRNLHTYAHGRRERHKECNKKLGRDEYLENYKSDREIKIINK